MCTVHEIHTCSVHSTSPEGLPFSIFRRICQPSYVAFVSNTQSRLELHGAIWGLYWVGLQSTAYTHTCVQWSLFSPFPHPSHIHKYQKRYDMIRNGFNGGRSASRSAWTCRLGAFIPHGATLDKPWRTPWNCRPLSWWKISFPPSGLPKKMCICWRR